MNSNLQKTCSFCFIAVILLSGCANGWHPLSGLGLNLHNQSFRRFYDESRSNIESQAMRGEITWVHAAKEIRRIDYELYQNKGNFDTSWKFDSYDEEYHSFCIAVAEKVDEKQISVNQYIAARTQKENQIKDRQRGLNNSQQLINQQQQMINLQRQNSNRSITCTTFGTTTTCR